MQTIHIYMSVIEFNDLNKSNTRYEELKLDVLNYNEELFLYVAEEGDMFEENLENLRALGSYVSEHFPMLDILKWSDKQQHFPYFVEQNIHLMKLSDFSDEQRVKHLIEKNLFDYSMIQYNETNQLIEHYQNAIVPNFKAEYRARKNAIRALKEIDPVTQPALLKLAFDKLDEDMIDDFYTLKQLMSTLSIDLNRTKSNLTHNVSEMVLNDIYPMLVTMNKLEVEKLCLLKRNKSLQEELQAMKSGTDKESNESDEILDGHDEFEFLDIEFEDIGDIDVSDIDYTDFQLVYVQNDEILSEINELFDSSRFTKGLEILVDSDSNFYVNKFPDLFCKTKNLLPNWIGTSFKHNELMKYEMIIKSHLGYELCLTLKED
ncbi:hypothetical protein [Vibrio sp. 1CM23M]|uniref:hypothetical protein n=1 Tax=Vibrio sp. 1CM23M TaxID=2929164 RepID=UPI0020BFB0A2|nr:hypothetical protein [Vibrio sp. 1CM23M]MCK8072446.1 hypothetical protein [Vibrio sp. 1CM23M]